MQFDALLVFMLKFVDAATQICWCRNSISMSSQTHGDYEYWRRQDQLVFHVILSSMDQNVITLLGSEQTSKQAWDSHSHHVTLGSSLSLQQRLSIYLPSKYNGSIKWAWSDQISSGWHSHSHPQWSWLLSLNKKRSLHYPVIQDPLGSHKYTKQKSP